MTEQTLSITEIKETLIPLLERLVVAMEGLEYAQRSLAYHASEANNPALEFNQHRRGR